MKKFKDMSPEEREQLSNDLDNEVISMFLKDIKKFVDFSVGDTLRAPKEGWYMDRERVMILKKVSGYFSDFSEKHPESNMSIKLEVKEPVTPTTLLRIKLTDFSLSSSDIDRFISILDDVKDVGFLSGDEVDPGWLNISLPPIYNNDRI